MFILNIIKKNIGMTIPICMGLKTKIKRLSVNFEIIYILLNNCWSDFDTLYA